MAALIGDEPRPRQERLDAAGTAAIAGRSRQFVRSRCRHRIVPPFAGNRVGADQQPPADHDAAADPGAENDPEHGAAAGRRSVDRFRQGKAIGVVGKADRAAERGFEIAAERPAVEPGRIGVLHQPGLDDNGPRYAHPDRSARADLALDRRDEADKCGNATVVIADRRGDSPSRPDPALRVDGCRLDLGAAEIDSDAQGHTHRAAPAGSVASPSQAVNGSPQGFLLGLRRSRASCRFFRHPARRLLIVKPPPVKR